MYERLKIFRRDKDSVGATTDVLIDTIGADIINRTSTDFTETGAITSEASVSFRVLRSEAMETMLRGERFAEWQDRLHKITSVDRLSHMRLAVTLQANT